MRNVYILCYVAGIENMSSAALCELYDEMDSLVRELSEELVLELARRDELGYEKELKNQFISLLLSVQRRHRALVDSKLRGGGGSSKAKDTPCTGSAQPGCVSSFSAVLLVFPYELIYVLSSVHNIGKVQCRISAVFSTAGSQANIGIKLKLLVHFGLCQKLLVFKMPFS